MAGQAPFENEVLAQSEAVRRFAFSMCGDAERTADLVQETMLKAFGHAGSYTGGTNCRAWLFTICRNSYITEQRRRRLLPRTADFTEPAETETGAHDDHHGSLPVHDDDRSRYSRAVGDEVLGALASLPRHYSTAVILRDLEGYSYEEVAEFARAPIGTIRARIHRGRKLLARRLGTYANHHGYARTHATI